MNRLNVSLVSLTGVCQFGNLAEAFLHLRHDILYRADIGAIAAKHLVVEREPIESADQSDANLLAIPALVSAVAACRLFVAQGLPLKIGARDIVEKKLKAPTIS